MNMTGNTILITGAGSGIGALAEEFVALDNEVIVAARSRGKRDAAERRGLKTIVAVMPHLLKQRSAAILIVSSGLAFVPSAFVPSYSATKAALHSYAQSLRFQL
ncbi:MAG TPA: SDR family NAD(P)-dependent oxidoreductase, partial [Gemmatimonadales bacterium]